MSGGRMPRRHTVHRAVLEIGEALLAERELPNLLMLAVDMVRSIIKADIVAILEIAPDRMSMRGLTAAGIDSAASMRRLVDQPDPASWEAVRSGRVVVVGDGITAPITAFGVLTARSWKPRPFTTTQVHAVEDTAELLGRTLARRASELQLRDSEERFRLLADRSPDVLFRTRLVPKPVAEYLSPSFSTMLGYTMEEYRQLSQERGPAWITHPEDRSKFAAFLKDPEGTPYPTLVRLIGKNGSVIWTEHRVTPVMDAQGHMVAIQGVIRDVTDRILDEQRRQAQAELTELILEGHPASEVLNAAAGHLSRLSGTDFALLALPASVRTGWAVRIISGDPAKKSEEILLPDGDPVIARVTAGNATVMIEDLSTALPADHALRRLGWMGSAFLEPIRGSSGLLGILGIGNVPEKRRFSDIGMRAVGLARQAALAIEYDRARDDLQRQAVLEDRARISRELHDGVIQSLFGAGMILEGIGGSPDVSPVTREGIKRVATMIDNTVVDVRSYIFDLRPSTLTGRNLDQGLRLLAEDFEKASSIPCSVEIEAGALGGLEGAAPQLVQIAREELSNVARHSRATHCWVELRRKGDEVIVEIRDDGLGLTPAQVSTGNGLKNIRGRAAEIGAAVEFISPASPSPSGAGQGGGTTLRVHIPSLSSATTTSAKPPSNVNLEG